MTQTKSNAEEVGGILAHYASIGRELYPLGKSKTRKETSMTATATKFAIPTEGTPQPVIDLDAHRVDMARRQAERDKKRDVLRACIQPAVAAQYEIEKPVFEFTVEAAWLGPGPDGPGQWGPFSRKVAAQNENDAWARFCDAIDHFPSRRDSDVSIKRGKQLSQKEAVALSAMSPSTDGLPKYCDPTTRKVKMK